MANAVRITSRFFHQSQVATKILTVHFFSANATVEITCKETNLTLVANAYSLFGPLLIVVCGLLL